MLRLGYEHAGLADGTVPHRDTLYEPGRTHLLRRFPPPSKNPPFSLSSDDEECEPDSARPSTIKHLQAPPASPTSVSRLKSLHGAQSGKQRKP
ncbi:hypothetical protein B296_00049502 [Ensete ventricosum]|uniref:Uncharacterized protein n=1 Tax=Ensete ventricosum TaxID=4639 RepID=A0A426XS18_ENSVE|nr:hypothetical protein B296_00049502 [Ensete ventricosum]